MRSRSPLASLAALAALLVASLTGGCGDANGVLPFAPDGGVSTRYALLSIHGQPLPATLYTEASGASAALLADTLVLGVTGRAERRRALRFTEATGAVRVETVRLEVEYRRRGARIEVGWFTPCPPNALCVGNDVGWVVGDRLLVESRFYYIGNQPGALVYAALP